MWIGCLILVALGLAASFWKGLGLEKTLLVGALRAVIQLTVIGYALQVVFGLTHPVWMTGLILLMTFLGALTSGRRWLEFRAGVLIAWLSMALGVLLTLVPLLLTRAIDLTPRFLIPLAAIVIGNQVQAASLSFERLKADVSRQRDDIDTALSLGATPAQAVQGIFRATVRAALVPSLDGMKILGLVQLPGAMVGMILAGASPLEAVGIQLLIVYLLFASVAIAVVGTCLGAYRRCFNRFAQLRAEIVQA